uniref:Ankyrin repeat domain-containing protein 12 n=1 Tax=Parascaris univalens TaxID=6257 RepID=A0A915AZM0_PARUN
MSLERGAGNIEGSASLPQNAPYRPCELELSDDGSSVVSDAEPEHVHGRRRSSTAKQRKVSGNASQLSPSLGGGAYHPLGSPLPAYPVSIRQQLAIIKQMEQPIQSGGDTGPGSSHTTPVGRSSPGAASVYGTPKSRRVPKVHKKNERGETPLHVAARRGEHRLCKKLLQEGALVNACDYAGWTPLHEACSHAHLKVAKVLISGGADVNACSESADTPLHDATSNGCEKLVWLLLQSGADRERRNNAGKRPIEVCPPECVSLRALLGSAALPERCPSGGDSSPRSPLGTHHLEGAQCLPFSLSSPSNEQPTASPADTDITVHSETCVRGGAHDTPRGFNEKLDERTPLDTTTHLYEKAEEGSESKEVINDEPDGAKSDLKKLSTTEKLTPSKAGSPPLTRRSIWREDKETALKGDDFSSAHLYEFDDEESRESYPRVDDGTENEIRRTGRLRGMARKERFSSQPPASSPQKSSTTVASEKRKQRVLRVLLRGRRRGRGGSAVGGNATNPPPQSAPVDDVYEFRSSPESDININV